MTKKELLEKLADVPDDYLIYYEDGDFQGACSEVSEVEIFHTVAWGAKPKTVILS